MTPRRNRPFPDARAVSYFSVNVCSSGSNSQLTGVPATTCGYGRDSTSSFSRLRLEPRGGFFGSMTTACTSGAAWLVGSSQAQ